MRASPFRTGFFALLVVASRSGAADWELDLDVRAVTSNAGQSVLDGGFGPVRYGEHDSGTHLSRVRLALSQPLGEVWALHLDVAGQDLDIRGRDRTAVGLTEAYLLFRPYPFSGPSAGPFGGWPAGGVSSTGYRFRLKAGVFHAPLSLENSASGWESPYTLSYSAMDSWVAQELRTIGVEGQFDWLGSRAGHPVDLGVTGGVFGWNDPAGAALANGGFTLQDRQTTLFSSLPAAGTRIPPDTPGEYSGSRVDSFHEVDHRAGLYGGLEARYLDRAVLRFLHYDNRVNTAAAGSAQSLHAWHTRFDSVGLRVESRNGWTTVLEWVDGRTGTTADGEAVKWPFDTYFGLVSKRIGRQWLSARYDRFRVRSANEEEDGAQTGHAWTVAYGFQPNTPWRFLVEWLRVTSNSYNREDYAGLPARATDTQIQLAARYAVRFRTAPQ